MGGVGAGVDSADSLFRFFAFGAGSEPSRSLCCDAELFLFLLGLDGKVVRCSVGVGGTANCPSQAVPLLAGLGEGAPVALAGVCRPFVFPWTAANGLGVDLTGPY